MTQLLSTKILTSSQKEIIANSGIELFEYNAIKIHKKNFQLENKLQNCIFTSQNTVEIFLEEAKKQNVDCSKIRAFCVGQKTAGLLHSKGIKVVYFCSYAKDLIAYIKDKHASFFFDFFCGNLRREIIPEGLKTHQIKYRETQVYTTELCPKNWKINFDVILFFSPSGVQSFMLKNKISPKTNLFCIGNTTAAEAKKYSSKINIAEITSVESVLENAKTKFYNKENTSTYA